MATDQIGGYKLVSRLGAGGTGTVFKAFQENLGRTVALKVLHPGYGRNQALVKRFKREIQTSAALNHPHIVKVYDAGQEGDHHYFSMEFIEGRPLREALRGGQKLPVKEAIKITLQMADALKYFHQRGMIHRDIKPENIMLDAGGNVKLMDFGIVKVQDSTVITQEGSTLGTPRYMSPEMVMGEAQDLRSDLFQLGVVLYEMLAGKCPFDGPTISAIATQITDEQPPSPSLLADQMPPALEAVVYKALEKEPANRYKDAEEMADALKQAELASLGSGGRMGRAERDVPRRVATFKMAPEMIPPSESGGNTIIELPRELNQLPKFLEKSFRSAKLSLEEPGVRGGLILAPLAFIAGLIIIWVVAGRRGNTIVKPLMVVEGLAGLEASWMSNTETLTEVEVSGSNGAPRRFRKDGSTKEHRILVKNLSPGSQFSVRIVNADESRSEPVKVTLPIADKLFVEEPQFVPKEPGIVELKFHTNVPAQARLAYIRGDKSEPIALSTGPSREHFLEFKGIGADEEIHDMRLTVDGVDKTEVRELPPLMGGARLAQNIKTYIGGIKDADFEQIAARLDGMMFQRKKAPTQEARNAAFAKANAEGKSSLKAWLSEKRIDGLLSTVASLASWVFNPAVDLKLQIGAYESLLRLEDLDFLSHELVHLPLLDIPMAAIYKPFVAVEYVTDPGNVVEIVDNLQKDRVPHYMTGRYRHKYENIFVSFDGKYYTQGKTSVVDLSEVSTKYQGSSEEPFTVAADELASAERVRFVFQIANMRSDVYLDVKVNNQFSVRVRPNPVMDHEYDMQSLFMASDTIEKRASFVSVTIPAKFLEPGKNHLKISCETISGVAPVMGASLLRVYMRLEHKGA